MKFALAIMVIALTGCIQNDRPRQTGLELQYADDAEFGIRCYRFSGSEGVSCVRLQEVKE